MGDGHTYMMKLVHGYFHIKNHNRGFSTLLKFYHHIDNVVDSFGVIRVTPHVGHSPSMFFGGE